MTSLITDAAREAGWTNRAHIGAFRKGYEANLAGKPKAAPYRDLRTHTRSNIITFSRSFIKAWHEGYEAADA